MAWALISGGVLIYTELNPVWWLPKERVADADLKAIDSSLAMYKRIAGDYPSTEQGLESLCMKPVIKPLPVRWSRTMDKLPPDPWNRPYVYMFPGKRDLSQPEVFSMGPDGHPDTADDIGPGR